MNVLERIDALPVDGAENLELLLAALKHNTTQDWTRAGTETVAAAFSKVVAYARTIGIDPKDALGDANSRVALFTEWEKNPQLLPTARWIAAFIEDLRRFAQVAVTI